MLLLILLFAMVDTPMKNESAIVQQFETGNVLPIVGKPTIKGGEALDPYMFPHVKNGTRGAPSLSATHENFDYMLDAYCVKLSYDVIKKDVIIKVPETAFSTDNEENAYLGLIDSLCARNDLPSTCRNYITMIADTNQQNPILNWIKSKEWDGVDRINVLIESITVPKSQHLIKPIYLRKWLLQCVGILFNTGKLKAENCLVFSGSQGKGKTTWFKGLLPESMAKYRNDGVMLKPDDKDSIYDCVSHWLIELGEIDSTFTKSEISLLKSFLSKGRDQFRRPYDRRPSNFSRRTSFFGTVNDQDFLVDKTGNRRFMVLEALKIKWLKGFDAQQLWAQVLTELNVLGGADSMPWELTVIEREQQAEINGEFTKVDPIDEKIGLFIETFQNDRPPSVLISSTEIAILIGYSTPSRSITSVIGRKMKLLGYKSKRTALCCKYIVPPFTRPTPRDEFTAKKFHLKN